MVIGQYWNGQVPKHTMMMHIKKVHMKIKDIMCEKCNFTTATPRHLQEHIKSVHDQIRDEKCDQNWFKTAKVESKPKAKPKTPKKVKTPSKKKAKPSEKATPNAPNFTLTGKGRLLKLG